MRADAEGASREARGCRRERGYLARACSERRPASSAPPVYDVPPFTLDARQTGSSWLPIKHDFRDGYSRLQKPGPVRTAFSAFDGAKVRWGSARSRHSLVIREV